MDENDTKDFLFKVGQRRVAGMHILMDMYGMQKTNDVEFIKELLEEAAKMSGATILNTFVRKFEPHGLTIAVILAESHITIHTFPEYHFAAIDIFLCANTKPFRAVSYITQNVECDKIEKTIIERGNKILTPTDLL